MRRISPIRPRQGDGPALLELKTSLQTTQDALNHAYAAFDYTSSRSPASSRSGPSNPE